MTRRPPRDNESEDLIPADPHYLGAAPAVTVEALEAIAPLDRDQRAERRGDLRRGANPGIRAGARAETRVVHVRGIEKTVQAQQAPRRPRSGPTDDGTAIVTDQRR